VAFAPLESHASRPLERAVRSGRALLVGAGLLLAAACQKEPAPSVQSEPPRETASAPIGVKAPAAPASEGAARAAAVAPGAGAAAVAPAAVGLAKYEPAAEATAAGKASVAEAADRRAAASNASPTADGPAKASGQPVQGAAVSEESFSIWLQAVSPVSAGSAATVEAVLVAKPPYHCNADYPHKFKLAAAPTGLTYPETTVKGAKVTPEKSVLPIVVQAQSPGKAKVSGTLSFSVCNEERCLVEKRDLAVELDVK
jgi:hypothetical protein